MNSIVIIGDGASGSRVATQLLRQARGSLTVTLVERRQAVGPGVAYATSDPHPLLNVPSGKMGAFPEHLDALESHPEQGASTEPTAFVPRAAFGLLGVPASAPDQSSGPGLIDDDPLALGIQALLSGEVATAIPEICVQAKKMAEQLLLTPVAFPYRGPL